MTIVPSLPAPNKSARTEPHTPTNDCNFLRRLRHYTRYLAAFAPRIDRVVSSTNDFRLRCCDH